MWVIAGVVAAAIAFYLFLNGRRNADPMNRKCAAEICEYLVSTAEPDPLAVREIFMRNARYQKQANHIVSMVPVQLMSGGLTKQEAMNFVPGLRMVIQTIPA